MEQVTPRVTLAHPANELQWKLYPQSHPGQGQGSWSIYTFVPIGDHKGGWEWAPSQALAAFLCALWQTNANMAKGRFQHSKGIWVGTGRARTISAPKTLDIQNKGNQVGTSVTHRTGFERYQLGTWRLGPERLSDLLWVTQMAAKTPALVCPWSPCGLPKPVHPLLHHVAHYTGSFLWRPTQRKSFMCQRILQIPPAFRKLRPLWVSSGWPLVALSPQSLLSSWICPTQGTRMVEPWPYEPQRETPMSQIQGGPSPGYKDIISDLGRVS